MPVIIILIVVVAAIYVIKKIYDVLTRITKIYYIGWDKTHEQNHDKQVQK